MKLACVDVAYQDDEAFAACLLFDQWTDASGAQSLVAHIAAVAPYEPGQFYRRELPCLLAALERSPWPLEMVVIDGYVWLGSEQRPGLGAHLYEALESEIPVIGVAKTAFIDTPAVEAIRGASQNPLWVTSVGIDSQTAAQHIREMHGAFRIPTLLKEVDRLCRAARQRHIDNLASSSLLPSQ